MLYHKVVHHPGTNSPPLPTQNFMKTPPCFLLRAVVKGLGDQHLLLLCQQFGLQGQGWTLVAAAGSTNTSTKPSWLHFLTSHSVLFLSWTEAHSSHFQFSSYLLLFNSIQFLMKTPAPKKVEPSISVLNIALHLFHIASETMVLVL